MVGFLIRERKKSECLGIVLVEELDEGMGEERVIVGDFMAGDPGPVDILCLASKVVVVVYETQDEPDPVFPRLCHHEI